MPTSHRGRRQRAATRLSRKINLSVSVSPFLSSRLPPPPARSLARSLPPSLPRISLRVFLRGRDRVELPSGLGTPSSPARLSHLHYDREDLLTIEYNADLSVSIHRDREPSSSRVPLRRGYTYPPSAARRDAIERRRRGKKQGERETEFLRVFCAWPSKFCASATRAKGIAKQMVAATALKARAELHGITSMISNCCKLKLEINSCDVKKKIRKVRERS